MPYHVYDVAWFCIEATWYHSSQSMETNFWWCKVIPGRGVASPDCLGGGGGQSWWASRWRVSANCALARTGGCLRGDVPPGRFSNFDTEFTQFSDNFYVKFIPLEMFKYTPFSIFFLSSSLSSPFSSPLFLPFSPFFSSLFLSFPFSLFLPPFLFPFLFSFSLLPSLFSSFLSFFFPFPLFPLPDFCSPSRFLVSGAVCPPCPPPPLATPLIPGRRNIRIGSQLCVGTDLPVVGRPLSGVTGGGGGGREPEHPPPQISDREISADLPGKKRQGKKGENWKEKN